MKEKKRLETLLKAIERIYHQNAEIQEVIAASMVDACANDNVFLKQVIFYFAFLDAVFIIMVILGKI